MGIRSVELDDDSYSPPEAAKSASVGRKFRSVPIDEMMTLPIPETTPKESLIDSLYYALPRMQEDIMGGALNFAGKIPDYYRAAKTEIPGAYDLLKHDPETAGSQFSAGLTQLGHKYINAPHDIADYAENRLNLAPKGLAESIYKQGDISDQVNDLFGKPEKPGSKLLRGFGENLDVIIPTARGAVNFNPVTMSKTGIGNEIWRTARRNIERYSTRYNNFFANANRQGFGNMAHSMPNINNQILTGRVAGVGTEAIDNLINQPTVANAHSALRDMKAMRRNLRDMKSLDEGQQNQLRELDRVIPQIEEGMFTDANGDINHAMRREYRDINRGYARDVIPYTKTDAYMARNKPNPELSYADMADAFMADKKFMKQVGSRHPALKLRKFLQGGKTPLGYGIGAFGAYKLADKLIDAIKNYKGNED